LNCTFNSAVRGGTIAVGPRNVAPDCWFSLVTVLMFRAF